MTSSAPAVVTLTPPRRLELAPTNLPRSPSSAQPPSSTGASVYSDHACVPLAWRGALSTRSGAAASTKETRASSAPHRHTAKRLLVAVGAPGSAAGTTAAPPGVSTASTYSHVAADKPPTVACEPSSRPSEGGACCASGQKVWSSAVSGLSGCSSVPSARQVASASAASVYPGPSPSPTGPVLKAATSASSPVASLCTWPPVTASRHRAYCCGKRLVLSYGEVGWRGVVHSVSLDGARSSAQCSSAA